eukprot:7527498-Lingulodinium_polyedra.AAC.1
MVVGVALVVLFAFGLPPPSRGPWRTTGSREGIAQVQYPKCCCICATSQGKTLHARSSVCDGWPAWD